MVQMGPALEGLCCNQLCGTVGKTVGLELQDINITFLPPKSCE